jgi:uncharacterized protein
VIFVDTNVFIYAVGRRHPLRDEARRQVISHVDAGVPMATSAEVLQELLHVYLPVGRQETLDEALALATEVATVWPIEADDVLAARRIHGRLPGLSARDLLHLAVCMRRDADDILTFDQGLHAAWSGR